jgi:hypothetical protein
MLNFWEKDFDQSIEKHIDFLKENLENQNNIFSKFSEIFKKWIFFKMKNNEEKKKKIKMMVKIIHQMMIKKNDLKIKKIKIKKKKQSKFRL